MSKAKEEWADPSISNPQAQSQDVKSFWQRILTSVLICEVGKGEAFEQHSIPHRQRQPGQEEEDEHGHQQPHRLVISLEAMRGCVAAGCGQINGTETGGA